MGRTLSLLLALAGGVAIAVQARITGALRTELGDASLAATVTFGSGLALMLLVNGLVRANRRGVVQLVRGAATGRFPWVFAFSGLLGAFAVYGQAVTVDLVGVALFSLVFISGQMLSSTLMDTLGWVPSGRHRLSLRRSVGVLAGLAGVGLALSPRLFGGGFGGGAGAAPGAELLLALGLPLLLVLAGGLLQPPQMAMNAVMGAAVGRVEPLVLFNYLIGTLALLVVAAPQIAAGGLARLPWGPGDWWYYTGGLLGSVVVIGGALLTRTIGSLLFTLGLVAGQLAGSLVVDAVWPTRGAEVTWQVMTGAVITLLALVLASSSTLRTSLQTSLRASRSRSS
ncbi:DMT family transporter [Citricoccus sp. K5]|uniref:DMT family transporter n=1 Tax=Citricoccus sp. K5 TaxID=2653135 RepID=UPI0012F33445|nr:DMT family transporter [Citricoccus sp. K5]VXB72353.1 Transporter family-2 protein [Citricoccus sp. K5]